MRYFYFIIIVILISATIPKAQAIEDNYDTLPQKWSEEISLYFNNPAEDKAAGLDFVFKDNYLSCYIEKAGRSNFSLKIAKDRIEQYKALSKEVNSFRLPWISISPDASAQRTLSVSSGNYTKTGLYTLPVSLNWELDIFGKNSLKYKSSKLDVMIKQQELYMSELTIKTDLRIAYYNLI